MKNVKKFFSDDKKVTILLTILSVISFILVGAFISAVFGLFGFIKAKKLTKQNGLLGAILGIINFIPLLIVFFSLVVMGYIKFAD